MKRKLYTVWVFFLTNFRRLFRDKTALFFTFLFPLIFLFVFGSINSGNNNVSFTVAVINESKDVDFDSFVKNIEKGEVIEVDREITSLDQAKDRMSRSELDAAIVLPEGFGAVKPGSTTPSGEANVLYTQNNAQVGEALGRVIGSYFQGVNASLVKTETPYTVQTKQLNENSLTAFDYTFAGLLGFSILGAGIFGPVNYFPELKKMGILRRFHTTTIRVWQYFLSVMMGNAVVGLLSMALMFAVAIAVFDLKLAGNYFELTAFLTFSIVLILGIGLAVGGWAKNERQAAPLANIIVFPMMFLSGTFFPRFLMPEWLQNISSWFPLTPVIDGTRLIATEGKHLVELGPQLGIMAAWLIVIYFVAFRVFRWE